MEGGPEGQFFRSCLLLDIVKKVFLRWFAQKNGKNFLSLLYSKFGTNRVKKEKKAVIRVIFVYIMIDSSHKHVRECKKKQV